MWCVCPVGGEVSAVWYALDMCGERCQDSVHSIIAASLLVFTWLPIVCGSTTSAAFAVRMAFRASWFALLKPMNGIFFGSHNITMLVFRCKLKKVLRLFMSVMDSFWSLCGDASSALFTAATEGSIKVTKFFERVVRLSRK